MLPLLCNNIKFFWKESFMNLKRSFFSFVLVLLFVPTLTYPLFSIHSFFGTREFNSLFSLSAHSINNTLERLRFKDLKNTLETLRSRAQTNFSWLYARKPTVSLARAHEISSQVLAYAKGHQNSLKIGLGLTVCYVLYKILKPARQSTISRTLAAIPDIIIRF